MTCPLLHANYRRRGTTPLRQLITTAVRWWVVVCAWWEQEGNFIDLSLTEDNSSPSASLVAITNDLRARTRFIVAQPVTFSAADPERREGLRACVCARDGGVVRDVKHMSPRVLRQGGVSREDKGEDEEMENKWRWRGREAEWWRDACRHELKKTFIRETTVKKEIKLKHVFTHLFVRTQHHLCHISKRVKKWGWADTKETTRVREGGGVTDRECKCNSHS